VTLRHHRNLAEYQEKPDGAGPVTVADREADALLREGLREAFPEDGLLTEETPDDGAWRGRPRAWMADPLDGTKEFVAGRDEYACMVGLTRDGRPVLGVVFQPVTGTLFWGVEGEGAWVEREGRRTRLVVEGDVPEVVPVTVSRSHRSAPLEALVTSMGPVVEVPAGSVGLKVAMIAEGRVRAYVNATNHTSLWDTCAPQAILQQAGGTLTDLFGRPLGHRGGVSHRHGLLAATAAVHAHLVARVSLAAHAVAAELARLPAYPRSAFVLPGEGEP
jgi:3'(2'), 5'-bisphosphate nucleotidase